MEESVGSNGEHPRTRKSTETGEDEYVLPQEQESIPSLSLPLPQHFNMSTMLGPIKEEEKEEQEEEWPPQQQQPMMPSERSQPRKIISQSVDILSQEQDSSAPFCSCLPQYISLDAMLRLIKKEEKEEESNNPEPLKQQRKRDSRSPSKIISQSLSNSLVQQPQPEDDQNDISNRKKKKMMMTNRGGVDLVLPELPETPKRERSKRRDVRVSCASPPSAWSSSNFGKDFATAGDRQSADFGLAMPPMPDYKDLFTTDFIFSENFFEDLSE